MRWYIIFKYECDSRKVTKDQIFIALKGITHDGHDYINEAIKNGAKRIISEKKVDSEVPCTIVDNTFDYLCNLLYIDYKDIINNLFIIGITGKGFADTRYEIMSMGAFAVVSSLWIASEGSFLSLLFALFAPRRERKPFWQTASDADPLISPRRCTLCTSRGRERTKRKLPPYLVLPFTSGHRRETKPNKFLFIIF